MNSTPPFCDTSTGQASQHTMSMSDLMAVYTTAMLGDDTQLGTASAAAVRWYDLNPNAVRIIP